ncbi:hypothetical protein [Saccharothrix longispora]|nr:hypothetical protein [Saccharothrix longispora]MDU0288742.1 hypothetical protein [Saccharothrix longispora]
MTGGEEVRATGHRPTAFRRVRLHARSGGHHAAQAHHLHDR